MAKAKGYKIKRNRRIYQYRSPLSIALRVFFSVMIISGLALVGWSAYGPVSAYLTGTLAASARPSPGEKSSEAQAEPAVSAPGQTPPSDKATPAAPPPEIPGELCAVYLPTPILADAGTLDQYLSTLPARGINAVLFDLKNTAGKVLYRSAVPEAAAGQTEDAFDLAAICQKLAEHGITPIGRLNAFRDPIAADAYRGMSVKYMNTQSLWLDNAASQGGKPWLNPYSAEARGYILNLAEEVSTLGVKHLLLDSVSLPVAYMLEYASFGPGAAGTTPQKTLSSFVQEIERRLEPLDAQVSLYVSGAAALGTQNSYYGGNPLALAGKNVTIGMMPAQFGDAFSCEAPFPDETAASASFRLDKPLLSPFATVDALYSALAPGLEGKQVSAMLQGSTATGAFRNNKVYTAEDINEQIRALTKNDIQNYILYSPDGTYPKQD